MTSRSDALLIEHDGHRSHVLTAGDAGAPAVFLLHGWPELGHSWRHQLPVLAEHGYRAIAPDMRGYGGSSVYPDLADYTLEAIVGDMLGLADALSIECATWVGHDWGSAVAWSLASHHPERCAGVASLCVPYASIEHGLDALVAHVDRSVYPADTYPYGQWAYMRYYETHFDAAAAAMDANAYNTVKALFRRGSPKYAGKPTGLAHVTAETGWFRGAGEAPNLPRDDAVLSETDLEMYSASLARHGFRPANAWYANHAANAEYAARSRNDGHLDMPVLFLGANYDYVCETATSTLAEPMRTLCSQLEEARLDCGHWMAQEQPEAVNALLFDWLTRRDQLGADGPA